MSENKQNALLSGYPWILSWLRSWFSYTFIWGTIRWNTPPNKI